MQPEIIEPKAVTLVSMLKKCWCISQGQIIHTLVTDEAAELCTSIGTALVSMYAMLGHSEDAQNVFEKLHTRNKKSLALILSGYTNQGRSEKAICLFEKYYDECDAVICVCALKACFSIGALMQGKLIHLGILEKGIELDQIIGNTLIALYANCSSLFDAHQVFISMPKRDVVSWCTLILGCVDHGYNKKALQLLERMQQEGMEPNRVTFLCALKACASLAVKDEGRLLHIHLTKLGLDLDLFIGSTLIDMYSKCECLKDSRNVFDTLHAKSLVSWSAMILGYSEDGQSQEALSLFKKMKDAGVQPDKGTCVCIVKACANGLMYDEGILIHIELVKKGFDLDSLVGSNLVSMYTKFGSIDDASKIFDVMPEQDMNAWSSIIVGHIEHGRSHKAALLFDEMVKEGIEPDAVTFAVFLKACSHVSNLAQGMLVHIEVTKHGLELNVFVRSSLIDLYVTCNCIIDARYIFDSITTRNVVLWNAMITRYADSGLNKEAFKLFQKMLEEGIHANRVTALCILKACSIPEYLEQGRLIHSIITANGLQSEPFVENTLIDMYSQCGSIHDARKVFDSLPRKDVVSWSSIINIHTENLDASEALKLFKLMQEEGVEPNEFTFVCVLDACCTLAGLTQSMLIHHHVTQLGLESNLHIGSTLVDVYARCGSVDDACQVFDMMPAKNVVAWSIILSVCIKHGYEREVFPILEMMNMEGIMQNTVTFITTLSAFSAMGTLDSGRIAHIELSKRGFDLDMFVGNSVVDMYARCGSLQDACSVFQKLSNRTLVSWNAIISGLADHGILNCKARHFLDEMQEEGVKADGVTFLSLLSSCSHEGLVQEGCALLKEMENYTVKPSVEHYICLIDMLGRAGFLLEAEKTISELPMQPNWLVWMTLLGSCAKYNEIDVGKRTFDILFKANCAKDAAYVLMSNIYSSYHMWQAAKDVRHMATE